jgi:hypothetical protein
LWLLGDFEVRDMGRLAGFGKRFTAHCSDSDHEDSATLVDITAGCRVGASSLTVFGGSSIRRRGNAQKW